MMKSYNAKGRDISLDIIRGAPLIVRDDCLFSQFKSMMKWNR